MSKNEDDKHIAFAHILFIRIKISKALQSSSLNLSLKNQHDHLFDIQ